MFRRLIVRFTHTAEHDTTHRDVRKCNVIKEKRCMCSKSVAPLTDVKDDTLIKDEPKVDDIDTTKSECYNL